VNHDPAVEAWFRYRRAHRVEVWHESENFHAMERAGLDGRELHRNAALCAALAAEPARAEVEGAMRALAADLRALRRGAPPAALRPTRAVTTRLARHTLRATFAPAALWGSPDVVQVSLESSPLAAAEAPAEAPAAPAALGLTAREAEVARLLARRASNAELAAALGVSAHTARHHTERVMRKLEVRKRADVAAALRRAAG
jgi:DNA-binding CsgD family transcriptional regulator